MRLIEVQPNPFIALDANGVPQGTVCVPGMPTSHIGALVDHVASRIAKKDRFYFPLDREGKASVKVAFTTETATAVRAGELLVTNAADARICGISADDFKEPAVVLENERAKALDYYRSVRGDDANIEDIPREAMLDPLLEEGAKPTRGPKKGVLVTPTVVLEGTGGDR